MDRGEYDGGWTEVSYRRGRRQRPRDGEPRYRSPSPHFHNGYTRPSYASVTRTARRRDGSYSRRSYREPGFKPQFLDRRGYYGPPYTQYGNFNTRKRYNADTQSAYQQTRNAPRAHTRQKNPNTRKKHSADTRFAKQHTNSAPRTHTKKRDDKPKSGDPDFGLKLRAMHKIIKIAHHLKNISSSQPPPTIRRLTANLASTIKPAIPNSKTRSLIEGNAQNWEYTIIIILRDHYAEVLESELDSLTRLSAHDWKESFQVASSWAKRNLGRRLLRETLEQAEALIIDRLSDNSQVGGTGETQDRPPPLLPPNTVTQAPQGPVCATIVAEIHSPPGDRAGATVRGTLSQPPPTPASNSPVLVGATPSRTQMVSVATTTDTRDLDIITGDLVDLTEAVSASHPSPPLSPVLPLPPKPQRPPRTISATHTPPNPCVVREQDSALDLVPTDLSESIEAEPQGASSALHDASNVHSTPVRIHKLRTAVQSCLAPYTKAPSPTPHTPPSSQITPRRPTKHIHTGQKMQDWDLSVNQKILLIGDSNLGRIPPFICEDLQIDSYPGATFRHAEAIINKAAISTEPDHVILAFGLNNRTQKNKRTPVTQLTAAVQAADDKFPHSTVWVPLINHSSLLPQWESHNVNCINQQIKLNCLYIPLLPAKQFSTEKKDNIHWTKSTARRMLEHWINYVNRMAP